MKPARIISSTTALFLLIATAAHAGLVFNPTGSVQPGQTVVFTVAVENTTGSAWTNVTTIEPRDAFDNAITVSGTSTGTAPTFDAANANGDITELSTLGVGPGWRSQFTGFAFTTDNAPTFSSTTINPNTPEVFGQIAVVIPADFLGEFFLTVDDTIVVREGAGASDVTNGWLGDNAGPVNGATFGITVVPEPNPMALLGMMSVGYVGLRRYRRRR